MQVKACKLAEQTETDVQHSLLDKARQCSADPDQAAAFFHKVLSPTPSIRAEALHHLWCAGTINRMFAETGTGYETAAAAKADLQSSQQRKPGFCAALCACIDASKSQSRQEDDSALLTRIQGTEADGVDRGSKLKDAAASSVGSQSEATALPEDGSKRCADLSLRQHCLAYIKQAFTNKSRRTSKNSSGRDDHPDRQVEQTKDAVSQDTFQPDTVKLQCCFMIKHCLTHCVELHCILVLQGVNTNAL